MTLEGLFYFAGGIVLCYILNRFQESVFSKSLFGVRSHVRSFKMEYD